MHPCISISSSKGFKNGCGFEKIGKIVDAWPEWISSCWEVAMPVGLYNISRDAFPLTLTFPHTSQLP
jgi:hypothetical protein